MKSLRTICIGLIAIGFFACQPAEQQWAIPAENEVGAPLKWEISDSFLLKLSIDPAGLNAMNGGFFVTGDGNSEDLFSPQARGYDTKGEQKWKVDLDGGVEASTARGEVAIVLIREFLPNSTKKNLVFLDAQTGETLGETGVNGVPNQSFLSLNLTADGSLLIGTAIKGGKAVVLRFTSQGDFEAKYLIGDQIDMRPIHFLGGDSGQEYWVMTDAQKEMVDYVVKMAPKGGAAPEAIWEKEVPKPMELAHAVCKGKNGGLWVAGTGTDKSKIYMAYISEEGVWEEPSYMPAPVESPVVEWVGFTDEGNVGCVGWGLLEKDAKVPYAAFRMEFLPNEVKGSSLLGFADIESMATPLYLGGNEFLLLYTKESDSPFPGYLRNGSFPIKFTLPKDR